MLQDTRKSTALEGIFSELSSANSTTRGLLNRLDDLGHKLNNTRTPETCSNEAQQSPSGAIDSLNRELHFLESNNKFLEEIVTKLESLI